MNPLNLLLERKPDPNYLQEAAAIAAKNRVEEDVEAESVLIFRVSPHWFSLPIASIKEIASMRAIHQLPQNLKAIGVISIRGDLIPCLSLAQILRLDAEEPRKNSFSRLVVMEKNGFTWAFPSHEIAGIYPLGKAAVWDGNPVRLLDHEVLAELAQKELS